MIADLITLAAVGGLILIGLALCVTVYALSKAYDRAVRRAETAERLLHYRQPGQALRVTSSPLMRHRAGAS